MTSSGLSGLLFALAAASLYGVNIVSARLAADSGVSGVAFVFYRVFLMLAVVATVAALRRASLRVAAGERGALVVAGLATAALGAAYLSSVAFIPVTVAVTIFYTYPVLIVLASPLVDGTRITATLLAVAALAVVGVVLVVGPAFQGLDPRGLALAAAASIAAAVQFFAATRCRATGAVAKVFWIHLLVLPASAAIGVAAGALVPPQGLLAAPVAVAVTIGAYVFGFAFQFAALARSSAAVAGIAFCAEPVVAALASALVLGERLSALQLAGGALVLAAILANVMADRRRVRLPEPRPAP
ncbi:MAG TPA: DMT family transporter [Beijerinckiaceae bacterium]|jgi:drug/metabolite transporter (DMT)-like permease